MPSGCGEKVNRYSCIRRSKDGDINSLLDEHMESTGWRIASPLPKKRPPPWNRADAGLQPRGQQWTPLFQGHKRAFVTTLGPFHAQCTPQDTAQRRSGIQVQKSYHMSWLCSVFFFFFSHPVWLKLKHSKTSFPKPMFLQRQKMVCFQIHCKDFSLKKIIKIKLKSKIK